MTLQKAIGSSATSWRLHQQRHNLLLPQLLLLSIVTCCAVAGPVSNPEISSKTNQQINLVNGGVNQQQQASKANAQEQQLNTINAYAAANYDGLSEVEFKPSYKLPDMESNFTPIQSGVSLAAANGLTGALPNPTPVIMQYLSPQSLHESGVQYLQLIPTRPLIVPISPFMSPQAASPYHQALTADNSVADYAIRSPAVLTPLPANTANPHPQPNLVNVQSPNLSYGLNTYANAIQPYRTNLRINREVKEKHLPMGLTLNLHEYLPQDGAPHQVYLRGRP